MFTLRMGFPLFPLESVQVWPSCKSVAEQFLQAVTGSMPQVPTLPECPPGAPSTAVPAATPTARLATLQLPTHTARQLLIRAFQSPAPLLTAWVFERTNTNPRSNPMGEGMCFPASLQKGRERTSALTSEVSIRPTCTAWDTVALSHCPWLLHSTSCLRSFHGLK